MKTLSFLGVLLLSLVPAGAKLESAAPASSSEKEKSAVLETHRLAREAHFKRDVEAMLAGAADEVINVAQGQIRRVPKQQTRQFLTGYMNGATYLEWDDLEPPIVRVSADGTMAWLAVRVRSRRTKKDAQGAEKEEAFVFSGLMVLEKQNGKWLRVANATALE